MEMKEIVRQASQGCQQPPQETALFHLKNGNLHAFKTVLNNEEDIEIGNDQHWIYEAVDSDDGTKSNLLDLAVKWEKYEFVQVLVEAGAMRDILNPKTGESPLHVACQLGDERLLGLLLGHDVGPDPNVRASARKGGFTPLHYAAQTNTSGHRKCVEMLVKRDDVCVDIMDNGCNQTPLFLAVTSKNEPTARLLIEYGASVNIKCGRSTIRDYIPDYLENFNPGMIKVIKPRSPMDHLEHKLRDILVNTKLNTESYKTDFGLFRTYARTIGTSEQSPQLTEMFNIACEKGLHEHVEILLKKGVDPNNRDKPILEAAYKGHYKVLDVLVRNYDDLNLGVINDKLNETILHCVLKMEYKKMLAVSENGTKIVNGTGDFSDFLQIDQEDYEHCWNIIMLTSNKTSLMKIVNRKDNLGNTALHYATQKWNDKVVRDILELGANIGIKNFFHDTPISRIHPQTMEAFLDEHCIVHQGDTMHEDFRLSFRYNFLAPDPEALPEKYRAHLDTERQSLMSGRGDTKKNEVEVALPETESLWYMGQSKQHRYLLKHPVITSFIWYKWQRIRKYFNRNIRLYILFVFLLTWFVFKEFGSTDSVQLFDSVFHVSFIILFAILFIFMIRDFVHEIKMIQKQSTRNPTKDGNCFDYFNLIIGNVVETAMLAGMLLISILGSSTLVIALTTLLAILSSIEVFQFLVSIKRYIFQPENWIENATTILGFIIIYNDREEFELNRNMAAIAILMSWSRMITMIGKHPRNNTLNIYVTMLFKVLKSFITFLLWYGLFLIAFGFSFYIMLHEGTKKETKNDFSENDEEEKYQHFNSTFVAVVKTITMFVGELEFSDIPINLNSSLMPLNYLFFLTFVFLIVVVLMNLLNGLAVSDTGVIQEQAEIFSYLSRVETISYLESVLLGDPFDFLSNVPKFLKCLPPFSLLRELYRSNSMRKMFTKFGATNVLLFFNYLTDKKSEEFYPNKKQQDCDSSSLSVDSMGLETIEAAKKIISRRKEITEPGNYEFLISKLSQIETKLSSFENIESKLDEILRKLPT